MSAADATHHVQNVTACIRVQLRVDKLPFLVADGLLSPPRELQWVKNKIAEEKPRKFQCCCKQFKHQKHHGAVTAEPTLARVSSRQGRGLGTNQHASEG